jgi:hypothetical protein
MDIEFRIINDEDLPPIVITMDENDKPKVVLNNYHQIWLSVHRAQIGGIANSLFDKLVEILDARLREQREIERIGYE